MTFHKMQKMTAIATAAKDILSLFIVVTANVLNFQLKSYFSFLTTALNFLTDFHFKSPHHDDPLSFYGLFSIADVVHICMSK